MYKIKSSNNTIEIYTKAIQRLIVRVGTDVRGGKHLLLVGEGKQLVVMTLTFKKTEVKEIVKMP